MPITVMIGLIGIIALLTVLGLSLFVTRIATVALVFTGLSYEAARFQARSAFTGTGFTTSEAESVVEHAVRRRIIMLLMLLRSAGIITIVLSIILSFVGTEDAGKLQRLGFLVGGIAILWLLSISGAVDRLLKRVMGWALQRWTRLDIRDYVSLLQISGGYVIQEMYIEESDWLAGRNMRSCRLREEGVTVIGIYRSNGNYVGVPKADTSIHAGDVLVLYGRSDALKQLSKRRKGGAGDRDHSEAVEQQKHQLSRQEQEEQHYEQTRTASDDS